MEIEVTRVYKVDESFPPILKEVKKTIDIDDVISYEESLYFKDMTEVSLTMSEIIVNQKYSEFKQLIDDKKDEQRLGLRY